MGREGTGGRGKKRSGGAEAGAGSDARGPPAGGAMTTEYSIIHAPVAGPHPPAPHGSRPRIPRLNNTAAPGAYRRQSDFASWLDCAAGRKGGAGRAWTRPPRRGDPLTVLELIQSFGDGSDFAAAVREGLEITRGARRRGLA